MEKEIQRLHRRLARSKFAVFLIIGFLALLTYLLITVANQVKNNEAFVFMPRAVETADTSQPDAPFPGLTCSNFQERIDFMRGQLQDLRRQLNCPATPGQTSADSPSGEASGCSLVADLERDLDEFESVIREKCTRCSRGETTTNDATDSDSLSVPSALLPPLSCETVDLKINFMLNKTIDMLEKKYCPSPTTNLLDGSAPDAPIGICGLLYDLKTGFRELADLLKSLCVSCPTKCVEEESMQFLDPQFGGGYCRVKFKCTGDRDIIVPIGSPGGTPYPIECEYNNGIMECQYRDNGPGIPDCQGSVKWKDFMQSVCGCKPFTSKPETSTDLPVEPPIEQ